MQTSLPFIAIFCLHYHAARPTCILASLPFAIAIASHVPDASWLNPRFYFYYYYYFYYCHAFRRKVYDQTGSLEDSDELAGEQFESLYKYYRGLYRKVSPHLLH